MTDVRAVHVAPERLGRWLEGFARRHPLPEPHVTADAVELVSPDGARARIHTPWGTASTDQPLADLIELAVRPRRLGALLVRRHSHAVGIFDGSELIVHRVGRHYVQGRTKAGGWSQQRYARRRDNQAERAFGRAVRDAAELLVPQSGTLEAIILGGDGGAVQTVLADPGLATLRALQARYPHPVLAVPDPNLKVLRESLSAFRAVTITLNPEARAPVQD
ncbi:MAG: acVLRF1 family peptidyl-tRNA hydrolase [Micropruina sp.]